MTAPADLPLILLDADILLRPADEPDGDDGYWALYDARGERVAEA